MFIRSKFNLFEFWHASHHVIHEIEKITKIAKLYLYLESALCEDYNKKKFFMTSMPEEVMPIAIGAIGLDDYKKAAPPMPYIHVNEYSLVSELAQRLECPSQNIPGGLSTAASAVFGNHYVNA